jgi:hypothetical protein
VTSDGHGGTLITDPPVTGGGTVVTTSAETGSSSSSVDTVPSGAGSVISGGYELGASGGTGDTNSSGTDRGLFVSGGGMVQLNALLAGFAGVISGFDLGNELDLWSLGFGSSLSAMPWTQRASGGDGGGPVGSNGGGRIFSLT